MGSLQFAMPKANGVWSSERH